LWEAQVTALLFLGIIWGIKFALQSMQIQKIYALVKEKAPRLERLIIYELYLFVLTTLTALFFILPIKTRWKSRSYKV
jgi:hypothetical protein